MQRHLIQFTLGIFVSLESLPVFAATDKKLLPTTIDKQIVHTQTPIVFTPVDQKPKFDIPVTYNRVVAKWIRYFQGSGKKWFATYLGRSYRYLPPMKEILQDRGLPQDLAYIAMIESGLSPHAVSSANAVGYWQFIDSTGERYGLRSDWWLDERRDYLRSTEAAAKYLADLFKIFDSWYLTASAYNMGENRLKRLIKKHQTKNFWELSKKPDFPKETRDYIPKLIAAVLISKVPKLYGFDEITPSDPLRYETTYAPGGTDLTNLSKFIGAEAKTLSRLNPALTQGFIPKNERGYWIRVPKGFRHRISKYFQTTTKTL